MYDVLNLNHNASLKEYESDMLLSAAVGVIDGNVFLDHQVIAHQSARGVFLIQPRLVNS